MTERTEGRIVIEWKLISGEDSCSSAEDFDFQISLEPPGLSVQLPNAPVAQTTELGRRILDGEAATAIEVDGVIVGFRDYSLSTHALGEGLYQAARETSVAPARRDGNRADSDRAHEFLCSCAGENLVTLLPAYERPVSRLVVSAYLVECSVRTVGLSKDA
jgi:hypothetical protein